MRETGVMAIPDPMLMGSHICVMPHESPLQTLFRTGACLSKMSVLAENLPEACCKHDVEGKGKPP